MRAKTQIFHIGLGKHLLPPGVFCYPQETSTNPFLSDTIYVTPLTGRLSIKPRSMKRTIIGVILGVIGGILLSYAFLAKGDTIVYEKVEEPEVVIVEVTTDWTVDRIKKEIEAVSQEYGVSEDVMNSVINCESQYNPKALGDSGHSRGLVQIHNTYHAVPDEDAYDPAFAIRFLAQHLKEGNGHLWTCWRKFYTI